MSASWADGPVAHGLGPLSNPGSTPQICWISFSCNGPIRSSICFSLTSRKRIGINEKLFEWVRRRCRSSVASYLTYSDSCGALRQQKNSCIALPYPRVDRGSPSLTRIDYLLIQPDLKTDLTQITGERIPQSDGARFPRAVTDEDSRSVPIVGHFRSASATDGRRRYRRVRARVKRPDLVYLPRCAVDKRGLWPPSRLRCAEVVIVRLVARRSKTASPQSD